MRASIASTSRSEAGARPSPPSVIRTPASSPAAEPPCNVSPMGVRVGIGLFTAQIPAGSDRTFDREYREQRELVRLAAPRGVDSARATAHHGSSDGNLPSQLALLAAFAAATERIELGTGVILAPLHDPLRLAEDAAVVDQISGGRLILGLGNGWREEEFRVFGA